MPTSTRRTSAAWASPGRTTSATGGGGQEATPLVWNGTVFGITNWSVVFAVDARTGKERWRWDPQVNQEMVRPEICCGVVNRGLAIYQGLIIAPIIDGRLHALDAATGKPVWESRVAYPQDHYTITMAPRIAKGKVIIGVSGGDRPTRGFFDAYDAMTGRRAWRFYTVPGDPSKPFENPALKKAAETWDKDWWTRGGGGSVWDGMVYDPDAELVYVGTGNAEPWTFHLRSSKDKDNLYVASILAVDVDTGELKWHYQVVPGDNWDFDSVQHLILADLMINGRTRKVIMQANKNAFFYVIDRLTGQFISAQPFSHVTWAKGIDQRTGRPIVNDEAFYGTEAILISPGGAAHTTGRRCPSIRRPASSTSRHRPTTAFYAAERTFNPQPGRNDWNGATGANARASAAAVDRSRADRRTGRTRRAGRLGSGETGNALAASGRRWHRRRHADDCRQPGVSGSWRRAAAGVQRRQRREAPRSADWTAQRHGPRDYLSPRRTAVRGGDGRRRRSPPANAGPGNQATPFSPKLMTFVLDGGPVTAPPESGATR